MNPAGFQYIPGYLDREAQHALADVVMHASRCAPFYRPTLPGGRSMSVEMTNLGPLGWVTDARGYRYESRHPLSGAPWPAIPASLLELWASLAGPVPAADSCLVNFYRGGARMGLHQDRDEADFRFPVISVSLGDTAVFRVGGTSRRAPTQSLRLASGDVCILAGDARLAYHGVDRIVCGSSQVIPDGGRISLTLRRARP